MTSAASVVENELHIKHAMAANPEKVDIRVTRLRTDFYPIQKVVRTKNEDGLGYTSSIEDVLEEDGSPKMEPVEIVEYEIPRGESKCGGEARLDQIMSVDLKRNNDDYQANVSKLQAASIIEQVANMRGGGNALLPDGHMPVEHWGGVNKYVIDVLKHHRIMSVQQIRDLTEAQVSRLPGGIHAQRLREEARAFLLRQQDNMASEATKRLEAQVKLQAQENAELKGMVKALLEKFGDKAPESPKEAKADTPSHPAPESPKTEETKAPEPPAKTKGR